MTEKANSAWDQSPDGLDLNPRPPKTVRVSKRAGVVVMAAAALVLGLFAYGGYKRQQGEVQAASQADLHKAVSPATAAGADIAKDVPAGNVPNVPNAPAGVLQAPDPPGASADRVVVRQPPPTTGQPVVPAIPPVREPTPEERRIVAAYEREQMAIVAPTVARESAGVSTIGLTRTGGSDTGEVAALLSALGKSSGGSSQVTPEMIRAALGSRQTDRDEQSTQSQKEAFLAKARENQAQAYLKSTRTPPLSRYEIKAGWEIPAVLEQTLNSDLPGELKALVSSNVYDTATGRYLLIPQGSRLVGVYNSQIGYGQEGVQVIWDRLIFPDASSLDLGGMVGQDSHGASGFREKVDRHYKRLVGFAVLTSLFAAASDVAQSRNRTLLTYPSPGEVAASAAGREGSELGAQITRRNLSVQPTIKIPVGYKFNVRVNRDVLFESDYIATR